MWGDPVQILPHNPAPVGSLSSTQKSSSEVPERVGFGQEIAWGRVGWTERNKKRMRKKRWATVFALSRLFFDNVLLVLSV